MNSHLCFCKTLFLFEDIDSFYQLFLLGGTVCLVTTMATDNLQPLAYTISSVMFTIGTISFFVRFYCRAVVKNAFGWDDVLSIFLLVCFIHRPRPLSDKADTLPQVLNYKKAWLTEKCVLVGQHDAANNSIHVSPLRFRTVSVTAQRDDYRMLTFEITQTCLDSDPLPTRENRTSTSRTQLHHEQG